MAKPRKEQATKQADFNQIMNELAQADLSKVATDLKSKKTTLEKQFHALSPYVKENTIKMILDYATILNSFHNRTSNPTQDELFENLIAATFTVAFATGKGEEVARTLPILAIAGTEQQLGKKIVKDYNKLIEKVRKTQ